MNIYVLNKELELIGIIDSYSSCIWDIKYSEYSTFELYLSASPEHIELLSDNHYLVRDKDVIDGNMYNVMAINTIQISTDVENGNYLTVSGTCLKSIVARRIVWSQTLLNGTVEACLRVLIYDNAINPKMTERAIPKLELGELKGYSERMRKQITGDNLGDAVIEICNTYGYGWRVYINSNKRLVVDFFKASDRSDNQTELARVTFSPDFDTLLTSAYKLDTSTYKNVALIAGEGEGSARKTVTVGTATGLDRYEVYIDSRDSSSNEGEITDSEYYAQLSEQGTEELSNLSYVESFEGEIEPRSNYIYGIDYNLGDIVNVKNEYGITATPRIIGVIESNSDTGASVIPTFSTWKGES